MANLLTVLVTSAKGKRWFIKILRKAGEMFKKQKPNKQTNDGLMDQNSQLKVTPRPKDTSLGDMFKKQKPSKQTNDGLMNPDTQLKVTPRPKDTSLPFTPKPRDPTELRRRAHGNLKQKPPAEVLTFPPPVSITCADPVDEGREDLNTTINGPSSTRQRNAI